GDEIDRRLGKDRSRVAHRAAGMRAAADLHQIGVAEDDAHAFGRHGKQIGNNLGKTRLVALAGWLGADDYINAAYRLHFDARLFVRRTDRRLDVVGEPKAQEL